MVLAMRDAGTLVDVDATDAMVSGVADDRLQKKRTADALAIHALATVMFPKSSRAFARLGDAQRGAGDTTAAVASYRKGLELNPRSTPTERAAAETVERRLGEEEIRALRKSSNAAMAAHNVRGVVDMMVADVAVIGGNGGILSGRDASDSSFTRQFADTKFITYVRTPNRIDMSATRPLAAEAGDWVGRSIQADGPRESRGTYLAMWTHTDAGWRIRSELFVTLTCTGSATCAPAP